MAKKALQNDPAQILTFPFKDEEWLKKIFIASLLVIFSFIPVVPLVLLLGYGAEIMRRIVVDQEAPSLPEWDDFSSYFNQGLRLFGVGVVFMLPAILLIGVGYLGFMIPVFLIEFGGMSEMEAMGIMVFGYMAGFGLMSIGALISMFTGVILPIAGAHAVINEEFQAAFKFKEIWEIFKANWGGFVIAFLILFGTAMVLYYGAYFLAATLILCCLYPFALSFMSAYLLIIGAGFFGDAYRIAVEKLPE